MFRLSKLQQTPYAPICQYLIPLSAVGQGPTPLYKKQPFEMNDCMNGCEENLGDVVALATHIVYR